MSFRILISTLTESLAKKLHGSKTYRELQKHAQRYTLATSVDGIWDWNLKTGQVYCSPRWAEMSGYASQELQCTIEKWFSKIHPEDRKAIRIGFESHIQSTSRSFSLEFRIQHREGHYLWVLCRGITVLDSLGRPCRIVGAQTDISEQKERELRLAQKALYDPLTGLSNRALFLDRLSRAIECNKRDSTCSLAVLFIDLDNFKHVNDTMGHINGDRLLIVVAERLRRSVRPADTVARFGGDEFLILLEGLKTPASSELVAQRIHEHLKPPILIDGKEFSVRASIGIAIGSGEDIQPEKLIANADQAMYEAKAFGKAQQIVFGDSFQKWFH